MDHESQLKLDGCKVGPSIRRDRDLFTIGASLALCHAGVDILRVHDVAAHTAAYRGWAHVENVT